MTEVTSVARKKVAKKATKPKVSRARTPPFAAYPDWSSAKFWGFIRSGLRNKASRWPPKYEVLAEAKRVYDGDNKRQKFEYLCVICKRYHPQKEVEVDHIIPAGKLSCFEDLPGFVERLFCGKDGLRVLCKTCHLKITKEQKEKQID